MHSKRLKWWARRRRALLAYHVLVTVNPFDHGLYGCKPLFANNVGGPSFGGPLPLVYLYSKFRSRFALRMVPGREHSGRRPLFRAAGADCSVLPAQSDLDFVPQGPIAHHLLPTTISISCRRGRTNQPLLEILL